MDTVHMIRLKRPWRSSCLKIVILSHLLPYNSVEKSLPNRFGEAKIHNLMSAEPGQEQIDITTVQETDHVAGYLQISYIRQDRKDQKFPGQ